MEKQKSIIDLFNTVHPDYITSDGKHKLNDTWIIWRQKRTDEKWNPRKIVEFDTVEDFWSVFNTLPTLTEDMWFMLRRDIPPRWEDPINRDGGAFKWKIHEKEADNIWLILSVFLVSENMCSNPEDAQLISGVTISPKKRDSYTTISIWNLDATRIDHAVFPNNIPGVDFGKSRYQRHDQRKCA
jgi:translation initiation factor 4E